MAYNIVSFGKKKGNLDKALETGTIGSSLSTFGISIQQGSTVFLHCEGKIWGTAAVASNCFYSTEIIWEDKVYPNRFKIQNIKLTNDPVELNDGHINFKFRESYGRGWAFKFIFSPRPIPTEMAGLILKKLGFNE